MTGTMTGTKNCRKILLLNPPGDKIYIRDYYCSKVSKTYYTYHPTDLLVLSGILSAEFEIKVIDAIAEKLSETRCTDKINAFSPDYIIFLSGSVSFEKDFKYLSKIKKISPKIKFIGSGDLFLDGDKRHFDNSFLDAILFDFTTQDIADYIKTGQAKANMMYRSGTSLTKKQVTRPIVKDLEIPIPRYDLFPNRKYRYPLVRKYPFATVLTDYGCPFKCSFCIMSKIGFKLRTVDNVMEEIHYLKSHGFQQIYFNDQTFGANRKRTVELLKRMIDEKINIGWFCFSRVDVVSEDVLKLMKKAGCHTIIYGVESGSQRILDKYQKGINKKQIAKIFRLSKRLRIRTFATFIIGLPGETPKEANETIKFAKKISPDLVAFNTAVPRVGTDLRKESIDSGYIKDEIEEMDQSGTFTVMNTDQMSYEQVMQLQRKATMSFYMRPKYIFQVLGSMRSYEDIKSYITNALSLFHKFYE
ncbi:radical SAM protein [Candidatus Woesearchaeota archaeon]|nr:radical SAM protein [Candidatus Woesearchaeota archaeon]